MTRERELYHAVSLHSNCVSRHLHSIRNPRLFRLSKNITQIFSQIGYTLSKFNGCPELEYIFEIVNYGSALRMLVNSCDVLASLMLLLGTLCGKVVLRLPSTANESQSTQAFVLLVSFLSTGIALVGKNPTYTAVSNHSKKKKM